MLSMVSLQLPSSSRAALSRQRPKTHHAGIRHNALVHRSHSSLVWLSSASGRNDCEPPTTGPAPPSATIVLAGLRLPTGL